MPAACLPARPRLPKRHARGANGTNRSTAACFSLLAGVAILTLGCGVSGNTNKTTTVEPKRPPVRNLVLHNELASVVTGLEDINPADRAYAASQLAALGPEGRPAAPLLIDCLADPDWLVRRQAAEALGLVGDVQAVAPLVETLENRDEDWSVRAAAARSLGRLGDPQAINALVAALNDMNAHVRHMAVVALGQIGTPETAEPLAAAARSDSDGATRFSAAQAILRAKNVPSESDFP